MIFIVLLTLLITLITLFFFGFNLIISTVCNLAQNFSDTADFTNYFNSTDSNLVSLANKCMGANATGDFFDVINISSFDGLQKMIKGIQNFNFRLQEIKTMSDQSSSLAPISSAVGKVQDGSSSSQDTVATQLSSLNQLTSCAKITFAMINTSSSGVISVKDKSALTIGQCYSYDQAEAKRALLEASYTSNQTAFSSLSNLITQSQSRYTSNVKSLKDATNDFNTIYNAVQQTFAKISTIQADFSKTFDCRILSDLFSNLEGSMCGSFRKNVHILMIFLYIISYIMFFLNCCICCMFKKPSEGAEIEIKN